MVALSFPFAAHAAWWNPLTWSWSATQTPDAIQEDTPDADIPSSSVSDEPAPSPESAIKYIDNPALVTQVQELVKENKALNDQLIAVQKDNTNSLKYLTVELNQCKAQQTILSGVPETTSIASGQDIMAVLVSILNSTASPKNPSDIAAVNTYIKGNPSMLCTSGSISGTQTQSFYSSLISCVTKYINNN